MYAKSVGMSTTPSMVTQKMASNPEPLLKNFQKIGNVRNVEHPRMSLNVNRTQIATANNDVRY